MCIKSCTCSGCPIWAHPDTSTLALLSFSPPTTHWGSANWSQGCSCHRRSASVTAQRAGHPKSREVGFIAQCRNQSLTSFSNNRLPTRVKVSRSYLEKYFTILLCLSNQRAGSQWPKTTTNSAVYREVSSSPLQHCKRWEALRGKKWATSNPRHNSAGQHRYKALCKIFF